MARAGRKPPTSARAIAAYNCGVRMGEWPFEIIGRMVAAGQEITEYMTPGEKQAFMLSTDALWWRWWWRGYQDEKRRQYAPEVG